MNLPLYFGVGLCNKTCLSDGLPIDVLTMILAGEKLGASKYVLVADTHARSNGFDGKKIDCLADYYKSSLLRACHNLNMRDWDIMLASEIDQNRDYQEILESIDDGNEYVRRELADMVWFAKYKDVKIKLGWASDKGLSEIHFDEKFKGLSRELLFFLYVGSGKTFDPKKQAIAPYFCDNRETRILLEPDDVQEKMSLAEKRFGAGVNGYKWYLENLSNFYDAIIGLKGDSLEQKLQHIIGRCCS